jgi:peptidyl-prolyl cis-trans isomerase SurA
MMIMKKLNITLFLLLLLSACFGQRRIVDKVVATVGGELVLLSEVEEQISLMEARNGILPEGARCAVLDQLLANKLLVNQAKLDSIAVSEEEVEVQLNARVDRILEFMNGDLKQFEDYYGQSVSDVKEQFREDLKNQLLSERMRNQIMTNITVTPSEVKTFFAQIPQDSLPYFSSEVEIGEIVYKPKVNEEEKQKAIDTLESVRQRIIDGTASFEDMARGYSQDGSARLGGDLGWAKRGKYVQEFEAAAYKLDKEEVSPVIETEFGYHIIKMQERRGNSIRVSHILVRPEKTEADFERAAQHLDSIRNLILIDSISFSRAVKRFSDENQQSYNNDGRMVNPVTGNTFFEIGDLEPDVYFAIDTMTMGNISDPFEFQGPDGDTYYRIVQLQSRSEPHRANLAQDYSKIQKATIEAKRNEYISEWISDKVTATYIDVDKLFRGCPILQKWVQKKDIRP